MQCVEYLKTCWSASARLFFILSIASYLCSEKLLIQARMKGGVTVVKSGESIYVIFECVFESKVVLLIHFEISHVIVLGLFLIKSYN